MSCLSYRRQVSMLVFLHGHSSCTAFGAHSWTYRSSPLFNPSSSPVGNIGGKEFLESLAPDVQRLLISSSCRPVMRKKVALCLLHLYGKNPDVMNIDGWSDRMAQLLDERDLS